MDYWKECIEQALEEAGLEATDEQVQTIVGWVEGAHDNYGMAHGYDVIGSPSESEAERELAKMKREKDQHEAWVSRTKPCKHCLTTGWALDGWGRERQCDWCRGEGRV